jgi:hypothetical protein
MTPPRETVVNTKRDGGEQRLTVDGIHVNLDFVNQKDLLFKL